MSMWKRDIKVPPVVWTLEPHTVFNLPEDVIVRYRTIATRRRLKRLSLPL